MVSCVCVLIDSVFDYDLKFGCMCIVSVDWLIVCVVEFGVIVYWLLEMYVYVDYLLVVLYLKVWVGGQIVIGLYVCCVQYVFGMLFNVGLGFVEDGCQFDWFVDDGDMFVFGVLMICVLYMLGYMFVCMIYCVDDVM